MFPSPKTHALSILRLCQAFHDAGHKVILGGIEPNGEATDPIKYYNLCGGFKIIRFKLNWLIRNAIAQRMMFDSIYLAFKYRQLINNFKPDLIYSRLTLLELLFVPKKLPIIYEMHSLGNLGKSKVRKAFFMLLLRKKSFKRIVVTTQFLCEQLHEMLPGIEIKLTRLSAEPPVQIKSKDLQRFKEEKLQGKHYINHVGYTGNLDTKGLPGIEIICLVAEVMPDIAFHIVGGSAEDVKYWSNAYAKKLNNLFFYGFRDSAEIPYFLNLFDIVLAPLQYKPNPRAPQGRGMSPLKVPEYMSYNKTIVASDIPSHREILKDGSNALMVTADDVAQWVKAIKKLTDNPDLGMKLSAKAKEEYYNEFTPTKRVETILGDL